MDHLCQLRPGKAEPDVQVLEFISKALEIQHFSVSVNASVQGVWDGFRRRLLWAQG